MRRSTAALRIASLVVALSVCSLPPGVRAATAISTDENGTVQAALNQAEYDLWKMGGDVPLDDGNGICKGPGGSSLSTGTDPKTNEPTYYVACGPGSTSASNTPSSCPAGQISILGVCQAR